MQEQLHAKPTQLYRHFDAEGQLLYVGISLQSMKRLAEHKNNSDWFDEITRVDIEHFSDRNAAMDAERKAVQEEKPKYNKRLRKHIPEPQNHKLEAAKEDIVFRLVSVYPLHSLHSVGDILGIRIGLVRELIDAGMLSVVELPPHREGCKPKQAVTGWSILTYIEMLEQEHKEKRGAIYKKETSL